MKIVTALNQTWDRLNTVSGNQLPKVEWYLTSGNNSGCTTTWDTSPVVLRMNLQERTSEVDEEGRPVYRNRPAEEILTQLVHLAAHASMRSEPTAGAEGRYHSTAFTEAAKALGLEVARSGDSRYNFGTGNIPLPSAERVKGTTKYASYLRRIDQALATWEPEKARKDSRSPQGLRCRCTIDTILKGMEKRGLRPTSSPPTAPKVISASKGVRERGGIVCQDCGFRFE